MSRETNIYQMTADELAQEIRDLCEKGRILHEARMKAFDTMRDAQTQHEFLVHACDKAQSDEDDAMHRLGELCRRQAWEMAS